MPFKFLIKNLKTISKFFNQNVFQKISYFFQYGTEKVEKENYRVSDSETFGRPYRGFRKTMIWVEFLYFLKTLKISGFNCLSFNRLSFNCRFSISEGLIFSNHLSTSGLNRKQPPWIASDLSADGPRNFFDKAAFFYLKRNFDSTKNPSFQYMKLEL